MLVVRKRNPPPILKVMTKDHKLIACLFREIVLNHNLRGRCKYQR
jgi:hypothetical protein